MIFKPNLSKEPLAIYIHWPFCKSKCPYCDFNSHVRDAIDYNIWLESYLKELEYFKATIIGKRISSIFFGGGTPSLMPPYIVEQIISKIAEFGIVDESTEITIEANPTSSEAENFAGYRSAGVNRLSIGVQALREDDLKFLGRQHNALEAKEVIKLGAEIFPRYSFDLIYGRPNQTITDWLMELDEALLLAASHISLYQLTIEKGTPFYKMHQDKTFILPSIDDAYDLLIATNKFLAVKGFYQYEVSNYALPGEESRHNSCYWKYDDYLGIGPGAHSRISFEEGGKWYVQAFSHIARPEGWLKNIEEQGVGLQTLTHLTETEILTEILLMGLRLTEGISDIKFKKFLNKDITSTLNIRILETLKAGNLLDYSASHLKVTEGGLSILNLILEKLL